MNRLQGKVALISGGTTGIGAATAKMFRDEGAQVVVTGSNPKTLDKAREELTGIEVMASDAGDVAATGALVDAVKEKFGRIDVLYVNAGVVKFAPAEQIDEALYDLQFNINVKGAYFLIKNAVAAMPDGGSIILTGSVSGSMGTVGGTIYGPSKAALRSFGRNFAAELAPRKIRVNTISPGPIETPILDKTGMTDEQKQDFMNSITDMVALGRPGQAEEIAAAALYFASDESSYTTGTELFVDGGMASL